MPADRAQGDSGPRRLLVLKTIAIARPELLLNHSDFNRIQCFIDCQGALDLQYLSARFSRGTREVAEWMEGNHRYVKVGQLADAQADLIKWQRSHGTSQPFLISTSYELLLDKENCDTVVTVSLLGSRS